MGKPSISPEQFSTFGELLKYLRRREELTQRELAQRVGYSDTQISRIEQNQRVPDAVVLKALFVPALHLEHEAEWTTRLLELASQARSGEPLDEAVDKPPSPNNLPASLTTFIGRKKEQTEIIQRLGGHRLVTLTGSGGVGKTRLALKVGGEVLGDYVHGVWLIELASLRDPALLAQSVAAVLGITTQSATIPYTQVLINFLRGKTMLLILDNCEHLLDACASLADGLMRNCPQLKILATSREALGILGEIQYRLPSLGLPDIQQTLENYRESESVRLFEERAQLAQLDFELTVENAAAVAQICHRLDGIPLAIELAAARVNIFSPAEVAARLDDRFNLLTSGNRAALPRQQTIRASIDWSWNLISDPERILLRRLTVFAGGWTLEAAQSVCSAPGIEAQQILDLMTRLVAKSLVITNRLPGRERHFHLHETIHQYVHEKLIEAGEEQGTRSRHLSFFLELSGLAEPALHGPQQVEWFSRLADNVSNLRAALEHASRTDLEAGLYLSGRLATFWRYFDLREGLSWATELVQNPQAQTFPHASAIARLTQGQMLWNMQQFVAARSIAEECLEIFRACGDQLGELESLVLMGGVLQFLEGMEKKTEFHLQALALARSMGDVSRQAELLEALGWDQRDPMLGRAYWEEAIPLLRQAGNWSALARTLGIFGFTLLSNGELESAQKVLDEAYQVNQQINNIEIEFVLSGKGLLAALRGDYGQARAFLEENLDFQEKLGNRMGYLWGRARYAYIALREGSITEAHQILMDVIENFHADGNKSGLAFALDKISSLYVVNLKPEAAARLIGWSDATRKATGDPRQRINQDDLDRDIAAIIAKIGTLAYEAAYDSGQGMTLDEAVAFALGTDDQE